MATRKWAAVLRYECLPRRCCVHRIFCICIYLYLHAQGNYCTNCLASVCSTTPPGSYCPVGASTQSGVACAAGQWCAGGAAAPVDCPLGTYGNATGAATSDSCYSCPAGWYAAYSPRTSCSHVQLGAGWAFNSASFTAGAAPYTAAASGSFDELVVLRTSGYVTCVDSGLPSGASPWQACGGASFELLQNGVCWLCAYNGKMALPFGCALQADKTTIVCDAPFTIVAGACRAVRVRLLHSGCCCCCMRWRVALYGHGACETC